MALMPFFVMNAIQAAEFNQATEGRIDQLSPRLVAAGPRAGQYVLPTRVANDPAHADLAAAFAVLPTVALETTEAWPPQEE